jgi:hypothetical protein
VRDMDCVRADAQPDAYCTSGDNRAVIRCSGSPAADCRAPTCHQPARRKQNVQTATRAPPVTIRHHDVRWCSPVRRKAVTRTTTADQSIATTPAIVSTSPEQPPDERTGLLSHFYSSSGKKKREITFDRNDPHAGRTPLTRLQQNCDGRGAIRRGLPPQG